MKYILSVVLLSALSFAGVAKFSAKHVVKPVAQSASAAVKYSAKKTFVGAKKTAKVAKRVVY